MRQPERIELLENELPKMKDEIVTRSQNTVKGMNNVIVTTDLVVTVLQQNLHNTKQLIAFTSGPLYSHNFDYELKKAIEHEKQYVEVN